MNIRSFVQKKAREAKEASRAIAKVSSEHKNNALKGMAEALLKKTRELVSANKKDITAARKKGLSRAMIDRLTLTKKRINEMAQGLIEIAALPDPVGEITKMWTRPNGMMVGRMRVPIGVIGIIYESRPNVTADATALCLKAGNAVILRGGSEAIHSNTAIVKILRSVARAQGIHEGVITFIDNTDRQAILEMLKLEGTIDVVIPRGGEGLIRAVSENSRIPVLKHYKGVCHVFVDRDADVQMAEDICFNAKVQRPGTCNAMETMLVDEKIAGKFLNKALPAASEQDFYTEYVDKILNIRVVRNIDAAMDHIAKYSSAHTDTIVTADYNKAMRFLKEVDSSSVFVNVSTRFSDGYQFGLGAEMGISTDKLHARGPMGLEELTSLKFIVMGNGQIRK
jgi:glutamate-5-semialdehyde dehydrogenase